MSTARLEIIFLRLVNSVYVLHRPCTCVTVNLTRACLERPVPEEGRQTVLEFNMHTKRGFYPLYRLCRVITVLRLHCCNTPEGGSGESIAMLSVRAVGIVEFFVPTAREQNS